MKLRQKEEAGLSWEIIGKYLPLYQKAAVRTVKIGLNKIATRWPAKAVAQFLRSSK